MARTVYPKDLDQNMTRKEIQAAIDAYDAYNVYIYTRPSRAHIGDRNLERELVTRRHPQYEQIESESLFNSHHFGRAIDKVRYDLWHENIVSQYTDAKAVALMSVGVNLIWDALDRATWINDKDVLEAVNATATEIEKAIAKD